MSLNTIRAGLTELRSDFICRFIEFWCQKNCIGAWRVLETDRGIHVWFEVPRDVVLFMITEEYDTIAFLGATTHFPVMHQESFLTH